MATKPKGYQTRSKPQVIVRLRELGYAVEQQTETTIMLLSLVQAMAEQIESLNLTVQRLQNKQPTTFLRA